MTTDVAADGSAPIQQSPTEERAACPFCGNAHVQLTSIRDGYEAWCKCGASMTACNPDSRNKVIAKWDARAVLASQAAQPAEADGVEPTVAREIAAQFYDKRDPLDPSWRDVAHNIRRGRLDDQDAVELVRFALAFTATPKAPPSTAAGEVSALLEELATYLPSIRVFLTSKERPHEAGVKWHDEIVAKINAAREARHV